jgi:hypothetical protein
MDPLYYYGYGEAFWSELITRQAQSSQGIRKFCQANGLATSTFHKWRVKLVERAEVASTEHRPVLDAMFIAVAQDPTPIAHERVEPMPLPPSRGPVVVKLFRTPQWKFFCHFPFKDGGRKVA